MDLQLVCRLALAHFAVTVIQLEIGKYLLSIQVYKTGVLASSLFFFLLNGRD